MDGADETRGWSWHVPEVQAGWEALQVRRSIRGAESVRLSVCQFADDTAILASTRQGAEDAIMAYILMWQTSLD